jgi:HK97 gp10 family phage protein
MGVMFTSRLPQIAAAMVPKAAMVVAKTASDVETAAKGFAPVDTGYLRSSIQAESTGQLSAVINAGADYAVFQEYGTRYQTGTPFMVPAAEQVRPSFLAAMGQIVS